MLEVVALSKIYKAKKGASVHALDNVSLCFPEKGMVFLLGKSGSGKSTLLNVCGGLDTPTSGEIIVKGRSSKSFTQSDFDSYRNTFIGFIFQEYNILNEFSVEDNIAIALELQGKPKNKKEIDRILEEVDLKGYAKRKPNTLSGGQKQRIAIARALVKSPEIIMADEPTGALDSATGRQVLETLKKLSRDKLVIVVSHDREFAEMYGDRIIELKDGAVISDVSKSEVKSVSLSENISEIDNVLCVEKCNELTEHDFEKIKNFLSSSNGNVLIAKNKNDVENFKKVNRISDSGAKEIFKKTDTDKKEKKQYTPKDSKFIRSKLPIKHAFKIGVSGMKYKPFRLAFTILLCTIAFTLFGIVSTLSFYDNEAVFKDTLPKKDISILTLTKSYKINEEFYSDGQLSSSYSYAGDALFGSKDFEELKKKFGDDIFGGASVDFSLNLNTESSYWCSNIGSVAFLPEDNSLRKEIIGKYPTDKNEVMISSYMAEVFKECEAYDSNGNAIKVNKAEDVIGRTVNLGGEDYKIVGILKSEAIPKKFDDLKAKQEGVSLSTEISKLKNEYTKFLEEGTYLMMFVSEDHIKELCDKYAYDTSMGDGYSDRYIILSGALNKDSERVLNYSKYSDLKNNGNAIFFEPTSTFLKDGEILVPDSIFYSIVNNETYTMLEQGSEDERIIRIYDLSSLLSDGESGMQVFSEKELSDMKAELIKLLNETGAVKELKLQLTDYMNGATLIGSSKTYTVAGIYTSDNKGIDILVTDKDFDAFWNEQKQKLFMYTETYTEYVSSEDEIYGEIYIPYSGDKKVTEYLWDIYSSTNFNSDHIKYNMTGSFASALSLADLLIEIFATVFLVMGIVLALFAVLLFSNFISVSISYKKREIGILRAVGARSFDVFKIFFSESAVISAICLVLSTLGSLISCYLINNSIAEELGASLLVFGPLSFIIITAIAAVTAIFATFLPVYRAARKKPVDSIRSI